MENNRAALGPLPAAATSPGPASPAQRVVLKRLAERGGPTALADLVAATGLHENTLREHLAALTRAGLVRRERATPNGRGRPAWLWSAVPAGTAGAAEYAGLAGALARALHHSSPQPVADAIEAGRSWGHDLAAAPSARRGVPADAGTTPRQRVEGVLGTLGFAPERDERDASGATVRLTRCPLLDAAREMPDVVCNVHLGLVGGILEQVGAQDVDSRLTPFAEPGACLLELRDVTR